MPKINDEGLALLKHFEGCRLEAYQDAGGVWTIGYGHTGPDVFGGRVITQAEADHLLEEDLTKFEQGVQALVEVVLNPNQFSALVCLAYNIGLGNFKDSTLLLLVNHEMFNAAGAQFGRWVYDNDVVLPGLVTRREAERELFLKK